MMEIAIAWLRQDSKQPREDFFKTAVVFLYCINKNMSDHKNLIENIDYMVLLDTTIKKRLKKN